MSSDWLPINRRRLRHLEALVAAVRTMGRKSENIAKALADLDATRKAFCRKPSACEAKGSGELCRGCSLARLRDDPERRKGEWFAPSSELLSYIAEVKK